jgi:hypothetical protein
MAVIKPVVPRWEWRVFGERCPDVDARLAAARAPATTSVETYIVGPRDDVNVKIRGGQLDIKRRLRLEDGLELWSPVAKETFPVDAAVIAAVFSCWRVAAPALRRERYTAAQLLDEVVARCRALRVARVGKTRWQASIAGGVVERAALDVEGQTVHTAAIESEHPGEVRDLARELGLAGHDNVSYVAALRRLLHVDIDPRARVPRKEATP